jgi:hypothetical protein
MESSHAQEMTKTKPSTALETHFISLSLDLCALRLRIGFGWPLVIEEEDKGETVRSYDSKEIQ